MQVGELEVAALGEREAGTKQGKVSRASGILWEIVSEGDGLKNLHLQSKFSLRQKFLVCSLDFICPLAFVANSGPNLASCSKYKNHVVGLFVSPQPQKTRRSSYLNRDSWWDSHK